MALNKYLSLTFKYFTLILTNFFLVVSERNRRQTSIDTDFFVLDTVQRGMGGDQGLWLHLG